MRKQRGDGNVQVFRITGARTGLQEDVRGRQRRYVISMSLRTVSVIAAAVLWNVERHVAIVALVLGAVLPYIAVVIANAGRENAPSLPSTFVTAPARPMLTAPPTDGRFTEPVPEDVVSDPAAGSRSESRDRS
ncbi:membrane protein [Streptomyces fumigatiscleroticus]|nr:membrane protein [Streptomyces fumigatiscleroticus]